MQRLWFFASLTLLLSASAQDRKVAPNPAASPVLTPPISALDANLHSADLANRKPGINAGSPTVFRAELDDEVPLPIPARIRATESGDVVVEPASGDPYFLGFVAGPYYPPRAERIDPLLLRNVQAAYADGRPNQETYAFVILEKRITQARIDALQSLGARVIEFHPHNCLKVALPIFSIVTIAASPDVRWVGVARPAQKLHPRLVEVLGQSGAADRVDVYINVFDSDLNGESTVETFGSVSHLSGGVVEAGDASQLPRRTQSNGWQQRGLQGLGVEVLEYVDAIRAFRARLLPSQLESVIALDYVQFVEINAAPTLSHDFSTPLIGTDIVRPYFHGGASLAVTAGQVDSGFASGHWDLNHTFAAGWDFTASPGGAWSDGCTHGSHVAGTFLGNGGSGVYELKGNAPGLGWGGAGRFYNIKMFNDTCGFPGTALASVTGLLHSTFWDGASTTQRPMVINNSWGASPGLTPWTGTEADARLLDDEVYYYLQDYVFASGNDGNARIGMEAGAKNVLAVGNVQAFEGPGIDTIGDLAWDSSTGPMGDSRWKPNVCAPGVRIMSVDAATTTGHKFFSGTSMAAPHVSGTIAQLLDNYTWLRYSPSRTDCLLMASAVTRNNQTLTSPADSHLSQFGTGRINASKTMWGTGDSGWLMWGFFQSFNLASYSDWTINPGCTRLVVCMHYKEMQASAGASVALKNNFDLYIDQPPLDPNMNTGDWTAQQSSRDNTEIRIIDNPIPGVWRWKTWPNATTTGCDMAVTVYAYYGTTTPDLIVTTTQGKNYAKPAEVVDFTGWIYNPASLAAGVSITADLDGGNLVDSLRTLADGTTANFMNNYPANGRSVTLGDVFTNVWSGNLWRAQWFSEGLKNFRTTSNSDNAIDHFHVAQIVIDGTPPNDVTGLTSSTHAASGWSNYADLVMNWNTGFDALSGIAGFSTQLANAAAVFPDETVDVGPAAAYYYGLASVTAANGYYFSVRAVDQAGNGSAGMATFGPILIDVNPPSKATNVVSTSHLQGERNCSSTIDMQWTNGADAHSGVQGYAVRFDHTPSTNLSGASLIVVGTGNPSYSENVGASTAGWYFHIATIDWAGNYSVTIHAGPYFSEATPYPYCVAKLNSLGCYPDISYSGTASATLTSGFSVVATQARNNKPGILLYSVSGPDSAPFQGGTLCVLGPVKRSSPVNSGGSPTGNDCTGVYSLDMNSFASGLTGGAPHPALKVFGTNVWCQWWGRDPGYPAPNNSQLSNGLAYRVCN